jgi:hypothetical protein
MDWNTEKKLEAMTRVGKELWLASRDTGLPMLWGVVEDEVSILAEDAKHVIQRVRLADGVRRDGAGKHGEQYGYRSGSFTVDTRTGSIRWKQHSQVLSEREYRELLALAKGKGWPIV